MVNPRYIWYRHCITFASVLQRIADDEILRAMFYVPPRHGKSETISRLFNAYYLYRHPERWVGTNSYAADLAYTFSRAARDNFQRAGGVIRGDASAVKHWETDKGGGLWAAGVGGPITGKGASLAIIDDPIKNAEEAASELIRAKHRDWYDSTLYTRLEPSAALVVVQTRWHERDLAGELLERERSEAEGWHIVNFEAIKEPPRTDFPATCTIEPDPRSEGEALCPERYDAEALTRIRARIGEHYFAALYQQRPAPREGGMFKASGLRLRDDAGRPFAPPRGDGVKYVRFWDIGGSSKRTADETSGTLMARKPDGRFVLIDIEAGQWAPEDRNARIRIVAERDQKDYGHVRQIIERGIGLSVEVTNEIMRGLAGLPCEERSAKGDKTTRADPLAAQCNAGNVDICDTPGTRGFVEQALIFPNGAHDDRVDSSASALAELSGTSNFRMDF